MTFKTKYITILLAFLLLACERDDICAESTSTTPRLLIEFYDITSTDDLLNVPRLTLYGEGLVTDPIVSSDSTIVFNSNVNSASLPLIIGTEGETNVTRFVLERDSNLRIDGTGTSNIDVLEISYRPEFVYVSRACGYKSIFNDVRVTSLEDGNNWISTILIEETIIENENTVHVRIFH